VSQDELPPTDAERLMILEVAVRKAIALSLHCTQTHGADRDKVLGDFIAIFDDRKVADAARFREIIPLPPRSPRGRS
jgi:hypothetical protein